MIKTPTQALAVFLDMDIQDLKEYEYQPSRNSGTKIFALSDAYYCAIKSRSLPRKSDFNWIEVKNEFVNKFGYRIFKSVSE